MRTVLAALLLCIFGSLSVAHDNWISRGGYKNSSGETCCGANDCFQVPGDAVEITGLGYRLFRRELVPYMQSLTSQDGRYWRCQRPNGTLRCFFAPPPSM
jgi:hypothetical protein